MSALSSLGEVRMRAIALLAVMFLAGGLAGAGLSRMAHPRHPPMPFRPGPFSQLGLTAEQDARVRAVFDKHRPEVEAILAETKPKVRALQDTIDSEVAGILTPEQLRTFQQLRKEGPGPRHGLFGQPPMPGHGPGLLPPPPGVPFPPPPPPPGSDPGEPGPNAP